MLHARSSLFRFAAAASFLAVLVSALLLPPRAAAERRFGPFLDLLTDDHDFFTYQEISVPGPRAFSSTEMNLEAEIAVNDDSFLLTGLSARRYRFAPQPETPPGIRRLTELSMEAGFGTLLSKRFLAVAAIYPGWYTNDLERTGSTYVRLPADALITYRFSKWAAATGGAWSVDVLDASAVHPAAGVSAFLLSDRVHLTVTLPFEARAGYHYSDALEWYGGFWASGAKYEVPPSATEVNLDYERAGVGARIALMKHLHLTLESGAQIANERRVGGGGKIPHSAARPYIAVGFGVSL